MTLILSTVLTVSLISNLVVAYKISVQLERIEDTAVDLEMLYIKLEQFFHDKS